MDIASPVRRPAAGPVPARPITRPVTSPSPTPGLLRPPTQMVQPQAVVSPLTRPAPAVPVNVTPQATISEVPTQLLALPIKLNEADEPQETAESATKLKVRPKSGRKKWIILCVIVLIAIAASVFLLLSKTSVIGATKTTADQQVFAAAFAKCQPIKYRLPNAPNQLVAEVLGSGDNNGCGVRLSYAGTPTAFNSLPGTEMTCDLDRTVLYATALGRAYDDPSQYNCTGSLVAQITKRD